MKKDIKICITGAGGFLGTAAVSTLLTRPNIKEVRAFYSKQPSTNIADPRHRCFVGKLQDSKLCREFLTEADLVLHLAHKGFPSDAVVDPIAVLQENIEITGTLLESMRLANVKRLIYPSSGGAVYRYDPMRKVPFHENSEIEFRSPFGLSKITHEHLLQHYKQAYGFSPVILRIANPFGGGQLGRLRQGFIGVLFSKILGNEDMQIWGNVDICKDFIYVDDVIRAFESFSYNPELQGTYNLGSGIGVSLREVITAAERITGKKIRLKFTPVRSTDCPWTVLNTSKLQKTLSWTCHHSLLDGMRAMWKEIVENLQNSSRERKAA